MPVTSDVGPTGAGSEVLRRFYDLTVDSSSETTIISGDANHIYTVLSILAHNKHSADQTLFLRFYAEGTGTAVLLLKETIPPNATFVFSDKLVIAGTDELRVLTSLTDDINVYCTYIDQQFAAP